MGASTLPALWERHFLDSAQLLPLIPDLGAPVLDLGTGAGFPGLVLAIMGVPAIQLVEHNMRKVAFLKAVIDELGLSVVIHAMKAQSVRPFMAGAVVSRALKPLDQLIGLALPFLGRNGACVFPKGRGAEAEWKAARLKWRARVERFPSLTDPESTIFRLSDVAGVTP